MLVNPHQEEMVEPNMVDMCTKRQIIQDRLKLSKVTSGKSRKSNLMWILLILFLYYLFLAVDPDPLTPEQASLTLTSVLQGKSINYLRWHRRRRRPSRYLTREEVALRRPDLNSMKVRPHATYCC